MSKPTLTFACENCGKICTALADITCNYQDGKGNNTEAMLRVYVPKEFSRSDLVKCNECYEAWVAKMTPVWKAENEARQLGITNKFKQLFNEDHKSLIAELKNFGPIGDSRQQEKMNALIACFED